ncbi:MAG: DUF4118 domain-containing protein, partial [Candidatus Methanoperedens sp.]|nr:DUF4118 domain-containing protein [Candidatus Methanoperedens sp.]
MNSQIRHFLFALLVVVAVTLCAWALRDILTLANFTTIYVLIVLVIAIRWGTGPALMTAFLTFLSINFLLVQPYYTFLVADPRELLDLVIFLVVAALTGQLAARARHQAEVAQRRAYEQEILYRLTRSFNQLMTQEGVYEVLASVLKVDLGARDAYILPYSSEPTSHHYTVHYLLLQ